MIATEINILPWYTSLQLQHHNKPYAYGAYYANPTPAGMLIPFQHRREQTGAAVTALVVVEIATGAETDILAIAYASGLEVAEYPADGYDLIIYPATLSVGSFNLGRHYLRMQDGANTWYSEVFNFVDSTQGLVKVEFWHSGNFCYPSGHVRYNFPYKGRFYLKTNIGKPEYTFEQEVIERNGKNFKLKQISAKQYKFVFLAPEYLIDAFRQVPLHDFVEITNHNDGRTYTVDEINMANPSWLDAGDRASVVVDFQTDTVIVKSGSGVTSLEYEAEPGGCLTVDYTAVAEISEDSSNYYGAYFISEATGLPVLFEDEDYVLITETAPPYNRNLYQREAGSVAPPTPAGYNLVASNEDDIIYDANSGRYYFYDSGSYILPVIDDITGGVMTGRTFPGTLAAVYSRIGSVSTLIATVTAAQVEAGVAIPIPGGAEFIYFVVQTPACPVIMESSPYYIMTPDPIGVGFDTVEDDLIVY